MLTKRSYAFAAFAICLTASQPSVAEVNSETGARDFIVRQAEIDLAKAGEAGEGEGRTEAKAAAQPAKASARSASPSAVERARAAFQKSMQANVQIDPVGSRGAPVSPDLSSPVVAAPAAPVAAARPALAAPAGSDGLKALVARHAAANGVPFALADAVVRIESRYNPRAANAGNYGLMQIRHQTARGMGYGGSPGGLLDAETNARYAMKYLAMAYRAAGGDTCRTVMKYQSGHMAERMSGANRAYCAKVRTITARN
jgi:soluble lytic murein transglycosylase-like protein